MLRVLDAKTSIALPVLALDLLVDTKNQIVGPIANRMNHDLQPGAIRFADALEHHAFGIHLVARDSARRRIVSIWFVKRRRRRSETALSKSLQATDAQYLAAEVRTHPHARHAFPRRQRRHRINSRLQFTAVEQRLIDTDVIAGGHVLNTGNTEFRSVVSCRTRSV